MDFYVVLTRPGYRVAKRRQQQARIGVQVRETEREREERGVAGALLSPHCSTSHSFSIPLSSISQHRIGREDAIKWFQSKFDGVVLNKAP